MELFFFNPFRDATSAHRAEALELQRQLRHLQSQFDMLTGQASALIQGRRARVAATSTVNGHLTMMDDSLSARNLEVCKEERHSIAFKLDWLNMYFKIFIDVVMFVCSGN